MGHEQELSPGLTTTPELLQGLSPCLAVISATVTGHGVGMLGKSGSTTPSEVRVPSDKYILDTLPET